MSTTLYVAAGGGGDALAALIAHQAITSGQRTPVVLSYSWDRYIIDPAPGPRTPADFSELHHLTAHCWEVTRDSFLRAGGTSGLTLLAQHTSARFVLMDPSHGAVGIQRQVAELIEYLGADAITLVDVGGDVAAHGDEPTLLSPLGDSLALAALNDLAVPTKVAILGLGLDGELPEANVRDDLVRVGADIMRLKPGDVEPFLAALEHHPSEATMLVAAAAMGVTGRAEIRDKGALVELTKSSADVFLSRVDIILGLNVVAQKLVSTRSFIEAEAATAAVCGRTELDHERKKAATLARNRPPEPEPDELHVRLQDYRNAAAQRGVDLVSFRRLTEILGRHRYNPSAMRALVGDLAHERLPLGRIASA